MNGEYLSVGLISGTSVDGIDAALFRVVFDGDDRGLEIVAAQTFSYPDAVRREILAQFDGCSNALHRLTLLNVRIGELFADAADRLLSDAGVSASQVTVIGSHGQTMYHVAEYEDFCGKPGRGTLQIGEAAIIARRTGIQTVSDFRQADMAAGGAGAPLAPFIERFAAGRFPGPVAFQNIGGIGNVGYFRDGGPALAFDTGPGNMIIDQLVSRYRPAGPGYDKDGEIARRGKLREDILQEWMQHPYLAQAAPKTTGRELFGTQFFRDYPLPEAPPEDLIHTAAVYTARSISRSYTEQLPEMPQTVVVSGGGAHHPIIMETLRQDLPKTSVITGDEAGISTDFKEAALFALMALHYIMDLPGNEPGATGAAGYVISGKLSRPPPGAAGY